MSTIEPLTAEQLSQMQQWYEDKIRDLPRKVVRDVRSFLDHVSILNDTISRQSEEIHELRSETFYLAAQIAIKDNLIAALEDVIRVTSKMRDSA